MVDLLLKRQINYLHQPFYPITNTYCKVVLKYLWNNRFEICDTLGFRTSLVTRPPKFLARAAEQTGFVEAVGKLVPNCLYPYKFLFHPDDSYHGAITAANAKYLIQKGDTGFFTLKSLLDNNLGAPVPTSICKDVLLQDLSFSLEKGDDLYIS